jgi:hypothetical protein
LFDIPDAMYTTAMQSALKPIQSADHFWFYRTLVQYTIYFKQCVSMCHNVTILWRKTKSINKRGGIGSESMYCWNKMTNKNTSLYLSFMSYQSILIVHVLPVYTYRSCLTSLYLSFMHTVWNKSYIEPRCDKTRNDLLTVLNLDQSVFTNIWTFVQDILAKTC